MKILKLGKVKKSICYNAPVGVADTTRNGLFENVETKMVEMKDDPNFPKRGQNTIPMYAAFWEKGILKNGEIVRKKIGSGWRSDLADVTVIAIRQNGYVVRGYCAGDI